MGLFQTKQRTDDQQDAVAEALADVFNEQFREEMRNYGREYFKKVIDENAAQFKQDLDATIGEMTSDLKSYMAKQLDATIAHVNAGMTNQLNQRLEEYDSVAKDAHNLAVQSLNRSAQALHDQYQQFNTALQKSIAAQEAMMISVYEENKAQVAATQEAQEAVLKSLEDSVKESKEQREKFSDRIQKGIDNQEKLLEVTFSESEARIIATKDAQEMALKKLNDSAESLEKHYEQLNTTLKKSIDRQKELLVGGFQDNMAQIVEHYLLDALSDQFDMKAQLPHILKQMEANKQAIMDDMKL